MHAQKYGKSRSLHRLFYFFVLLFFKAAFRCNGKSASTWFSNGESHIDNGWIKWIFYAPTKIKSFRRKCGKFYLNNCTVIFIQDTSCDWIMWDNLPHLVTFKLYVNTEQIHIGRKGNQFVHYHYIRNPRVLSQWIRFSFE